VWHRLASQPKRLALASAGVAVGAGTLVFLVNLTSSVTAAADRGLEDMGGRTVLLSSRAPASRREVQALSIADARAIEREVRGVVRVSPNIRIRSGVQCNGRTATATIAGVNPEQIRSNRQTLSNGRFIADIDEQRRSAVCVVGADIARRLRCDGQADAVLSLGRTACRRIGILQERTSMEDDTVFVPASFLTAAIGQNVNGPMTLTVDLAPQPSEDRIIDAIETVMRRRHGIRHEDDEDFTVTRRQDVADNLRQLVGGANRLVWILVLWSLSIAAFGIANAVLTSVVERVPEIGIQRAVGARRAHIRLEFLIEGSAIGITGALAGIACGVASSALVGSILGLPPAVSKSAIFGAFASALCLGATAAAWPASYAARLEPAAAIRHD
jgi:putative ABC transport system permease protein